MHDPDNNQNVERPRRPYEPPAIEESCDFETLALACTTTGEPCSPQDPFDPSEPSS